MAPLMLLKLLKEFELLEHLDLQFYQSFQPSIQTGSFSTTSDSSGFLILPAPSVSLEETFRSCEGAKEDVMREVAPLGIL